MNEKQTMEHIGNYLRDIRKEKRLRLKDVSEGTGISISFLSDLERNCTNPSLATFWKLCTFYGVWPSEVLDQYEKDLYSETCQSCGEKVEEVWRCDDWLWEKVTGRSDGGGLWCIRCFTREALREGISLAWHCEVMEAEEE